MKASLIPSCGALLALLLTSPMASGAVAEPAAPVIPSQLLRADFGTVSKTGPKAAFEQTDIVPHKTGQTYGWLMLVKTSEATVHWREEMDLPRPPAHWNGVDEAHPATHLEDPQHVVTEKDDVPVNGLLQHFWQVAEGDPTGEYKIRLFLGDKLVRTFSFQVQ